MSRQIHRSEFMPSSQESDDLFVECVKLGADRGAVAAWPDFRRREFIAQQGFRNPTPREMIIGHFLNVVTGKNGHNGTYTYY